jgi:hypothetical protein
MTVKARFKCIEIKNVYTGADPNSRLAAITLIPVYNDGNGNESWSKATPSGKLEMNVTNGEAIDQFALGNEYELTFEVVKKV